MNTVVSKFLQGTADTKPFDIFLQISCRVFMPTKILIIGRQQTMLLH